MPLVALKRAVTQSIQYVENHGRGRFESNLERLRETKFHIKRRYTPFPSKSVVLGRREIHVAHWFPEWGVEDQASGLLHSSVHEGQYERFGFFKAWFCYPIPSWRFSLEREAVKVNAKWWFTLGVIANDVSGKNYVDKVVDIFPRNYWLRGWWTQKHRDELAADLYSVFTEDFSGNGRG